MGASEATLLSKLGIKPFSYGLIIQQVYDNGSLYDPKVRPRLPLPPVASPLASALTLPAGLPMLARPVVQRPARPAFTPLSLSRLPEA